MRKNIQYLNINDEIWCVCCDSFELQDVQRMAAPLVSWLDRILTWPSKAILKNHILYGTVHPAHNFRLISDFLQEL